LAKYDLDFALIENSPSLVVLGLDRVLADLATLGFDAEWGVLSAADLGAPHDRERLWIVARNISDTNGMRGLQPQRSKRNEWLRAGGVCKKIPDAMRQGLQGREDGRGNGIDWPHARLPTACRTSSPALASVAG